MNDIHFRQLLEGYVAGILSESDKSKFFDLLEDQRYRKILEETLEQEWKDGRYEIAENQRVYQFLENAILDKIKTVSVPVDKRDARVFPIKKYRLTAAAVLLFLIIGGAVWFYRGTGSVNRTVSKGPVQQIEIGPGSNGAILTLEDGRQIALDTISNGVVANQSGMDIVREKNELEYKPGHKENTVPVYNTISTPKGKQYPNLVLSDGTKVWLDAGSSIRFPVAFTGDERKVEITGQVWFDIVHDNKMPFKVFAKGVEITDIGTQFNVKAYEDEEAVRITLLQGVVKVQNSLLSPGEQAQVSDAGFINLRKNVDLEEVTAWKNGRFVFNDAGIREVMKDLARWYDLDVIYTGSINEKFHIEITRNTNLSSVLKIMQATGAVHFKIDGKRITVMP